MYESRAYDNPYGEPVVVMVITGTQDVSRFANLLAGGNPFVEQILTADTLHKQIKRHSGGRKALELLGAHGGPDLLADERECAWHEVRVYDGQDIFTGAPARCADITHPDVCHHLPPGAVCWYEYEPFRIWWPADLGTYRIRPVEHTVGGTEDGPDIEVALDIQIRTTADDADHHEWADWDGETFYESVYGRSAEKDRQQPVPAVTGARHAAPATTDTATAATS